MCRRIISTPFTYNAFIVSLELYGNKISPMMYYSHHCVRFLSQLVHVISMRDERIPNSLLYNESVGGKHNRDRLALDFKDVWKRDLKCWSVVLISRRSLLITATNYFIFPIIKNSRVIKLVLKETKVDKETRLNFEYNTCFIYYFVDLLCYFLVNCIHS